MLQELRIRDFAIIDELDLQFDAGLVVLTGETGAGKSIIVDAVELVLGEWADSTVVRSGAERAILEAVFRLEPGPYPVQTRVVGVPQPLEQRPLLRC